MNEQKRTNKYLKKLKSGKLGSFDELFRLMYPYVRVVAYSELCNKIYTDDVILQTFDAVKKNIGDFDETKSGQSWIGSIARNIARNINEHEMRLKLRESDYAKKTVAATVSDDELTEYADLNVAMQKLDPEERQIVELRAIYDYTYEQIAEKTGLAVSTVFERYKKVADKLINLLK